MRTLASVRKVTAAGPIPNADAIERTRVLGWWVVTKRGEFKPGDRVVYCEIDSLLPERPEFEFLRASVSHFPKCLPPEWLKWVGETPPPERRACSPGRIGHVRRMAEWF